MTRDKQVSRGDFLRATGAAAGLSTLVPNALANVPGAAAASRSRAYTGKLAVIGTGPLTPPHGLYKLFKDFEKQNPGVSISYSVMPSERFVALFTAAQASGEHIDV